MKWTVDVCIYVLDTRNAHAHILPRVGQQLTLAHRLTQIPAPLSTTSVVLKPCHYSQTAAPLRVYPLTYAR